MRSSRNRFVTRVGLTWVLGRMHRFPRSRAKAAVLGAAIFAALGPPIGLFVFLVNFALWETFNFDPLIGPMMVLPSLTHLLFAYLFGGVPCLLTGFTAGFFRSRIRSPSSCLAVGLLGFTLSFAPLALFGKAGNLASNLLFFGLPGLTAGIACAWVIRVRSNNSFKPNPLRGPA